MLRNADIVDTRSLPQEFRLHTLLWWGLACIEVFLFTQIILQYFITGITNSFTTAIYTVTQYITYPVAIVLTNGNTLLTTLLAIIGYFLLTVAVVSFLKTLQSPRIRIEHARALSRRKYNY